MGIASHGWGDDLILLFDSCIGSIYMFICIIEYNKLNLFVQVHVVPAHMFRKVISITKSHCKLGLTGIADIVGLDNYQHPASYLFFLEVKICFNNCSHTCSRGWEDYRSQLPYWSQTIWSKLVGFGKGRIYCKCTVCWSMVSNDKGVFCWIFEEGKLQEKTGLAILKIVILVGIRFL